MIVDSERYQGIVKEVNAAGVTLVAVSKTKPVEDIQALYDLGQRDFGENYVQELSEKAAQLPADIRWHFIGHLQTNKVKYIAPFVHLIQVVDSWKLLQEIDKQAAKNNRVIDCLLQVHIAREETKFGLDEKELDEMITRLGTMPLANIRVRGLMGMASFVENGDVIKKEFHFLKTLFDKYSTFLDAGSKTAVRSMGMSSDYKVAIEQGSNMVRIGSLIFGERGG
ncbi:MAG TPA: YggS family pyridoxal phosphate-dependent enzyme [Chitinophagaceae bacterium]|nr:YggS family pyridoxal phosphate-dependent enzyme [Chitinophagaceae bacterium]